MPILFVTLCPKDGHADVYSAEFLTAEYVTNSD